MSEYLFTRKLESLTSKRNFKMDIGGHVAWASKCIAQLF